MAMSSVVMKLVNEMGGPGLLQALRGVGHNVKTLEEVTPDMIAALTAKNAKMKRPAIEDEISGEEADKFARALEGLDKKPGGKLRETQGPVEQAGPMQQAITKEAVKKVAMPPALKSKLVSEMGEKGLLQEAKKVDKSIQSLDDISPELAATIFGRRKPVARPESAGADISGDELNMFAKSVDKVDRKPGAPLRETQGPTEQAGPQQNLGLDNPEGFGPETPALYPKPRDFNSKSRGMDSDLDSMFAAEAAPGAGAPKSNMKKILAASGAATAAGAAAYTANRGATASWGDDSLSAKAGGKAGPVNDQGLEFGKVPGAPKTLQETISENNKPSAAASSLPGVPVPKAKARPEDFVAGKFSYDDAEYKNSLKDIEDRRGKAEEKFQRSRDRSEMGEVAERIAQSVAQYGAARQGLRDNVDLSGLKFQGTDWDKIIGRREGDLKRENDKLNAETGLSKEKNEIGRREAKDSFEGNENARKYNHGKAWDEYVNSLNAQERAQLKNAELKIQQARDAANRQENLVDYEERKKIDAKYRKDEDEKLADAEVKAEKKAAQKQAEARKTALQGIYASIAADIDDEKLEQKIAGYGKALNPEDVQAIMDADGGIFGRASTARKEVIKGLLSQSGQAAPSSGKVKVLHEASGQTKEYNADDPALEKVLSKPGFKRVD